MHRKSLIYISSLIGITLFGYKAESSALELEKATNELTQERVRYKELYQYQKSLNKGRVDSSLKHSLNNRRDEFLQSQARVMQLADELEQIKSEIYRAKNGD